MLRKVRRQGGAQAPPLTPINIRPIGTTVENRYAVLHIQKCKSNVYALGRHIHRANTPHNADAERQHLNRHIIMPTDGNLMKAINERIADGYKGNTAIRKDAVKAISLILTGSHDIMKRIEEEGRLNEWVNANHDWLKNKYGPDNIVQLSLHMDERTPHLHAVVVPLTADGRLSAKEIVGNKRDLEKVQDEYHYSMLMSGFYDFRRGIRGNRVRHTDINDYYRNLELVKERKQDIMQSLPFLNSREKVNALSGKLVEDLMTLKQQKNEPQKDNFKPFKPPKRDFGMGI